MKPISKGVFNSLCLKNVSTSIVHYLLFVSFFLLMRINQYMIFHNSPWHVKNIDTLTLYVVLQGVGPGGAAVCIGVVGHVGSDR